LNVTAKHREKKFPGAIVSGIDHDTLDLKTIDFVYEKLPEWRDDPSRPDEQWEDKLNLQLCKFLDSRAREEFPMVRFDHEEYQTDRRRVDLSASPARPMIIKAEPHSIYKPFLVLEGKRLPAPSRDREKEYVTGGAEKSTGGMQRFKLGLHGAEMDLAAIIGYVQESSFHGWHMSVNKWILELSDGSESDKCVWNADEILEPVRENASKSVTDYRSVHTRTRCESGHKITLRHLWVLMKTPHF
jgi:hypothetical protein